MFQLHKVLPLGAPGARMGVITGKEGSQGHTAEHVHAKCCARFLTCTPSPRPHRRPEEGC